MIVLSNTTAQTLAVGQSITFDIVVLHTGCGECHRTNSASVKLRCQGIYELSFSANVTSTTTGPVQLSLQIGGETLNETTMISTPAATGNVNNIATKTAVKNCCGDYDRITVTNTGTNPIVVEPNSDLFIKRVA